MSSEEENEWLSQLKVGDNFKLSERHSSRGYTVYKISRETKSRFFYWINAAVKCEGSFRKSDGLVIGSNDGGRFSYPIYAKKITQADLDYTYRRSLLIYVERKQWEKFSTDQLKCVYDLVELLEGELKTKEQGEK